MVPVRVNRGDGRDTSRPYGSRVDISTDRVPTAPLPDDALAALLYVEATGGLAREAAALQVMRMDAA